MVISGLLITVNKNSVQASDPSIKITTWCKEFFSFTREKVTNEKDVIFSENQIEYIPQGFKKTEADITLSYALLKYADEMGNYMFIKVDYDDVLSNVDSSQILKDSKISEKGIEYLVIENKNKKETSILFQGKNMLYYTITGTISENELINVMNGINQ
jgi:hypothetical protein